MMSIVSVLSTCPAAGQDTPRDAIELYFQAHATGNGDYIRQAFTPDATIEFVDHGELKRWTREEFAQRFRGPAADEYRRVRRVESLDVNGTAASAVVTLDYPQVLFRDRLLLLKIGNRWKIVNKVFSTEQREAAQAALDKMLADWSLPFEPRSIIGNIYYVGSNLISSFLIVTPAGHILIDTGHIQLLPQVEANIEKLGFNVHDVKFVLNTQAHIDHCGGFAEFKRQKGATIIASRLDAEMMKQGGKGDYANTGAYGNGEDVGYEPVTPDRIVADGDRVEIGGVSLTAHLTPGHTKGCTSWSMRADENGKEFDVLFLCGLTVSPYKLTNNDRYPNMVADVRSSFIKLRSMHAEVFLAAHGFWFDLEGKAAPNARRAESVHRSRRTGTPSDRDGAGLRTGFSGTGAAEMIGARRKKVRAVERKLILPVAVEMCTIRARGQLHLASECHSRRDQNDTLKMPGWDQPFSLAVHEGGARPGHLLFCTHKLRADRIAGLAPLALFNG